MIELLNNPTSDNERNVLNADLFVSNLRHTLDGFRFNTDIKYTVYRNITIYEISWNDDKTYDDIYSLRREIALALGINVKDLKMENKGNNKVEIIQRNMKIDPLSLKEVLTDFRKDNSVRIALGLDDYERIVYFDMNRDKNLLVIGVSGTGKTNLFNVMILNILINYSDKNIVIMDLQGINYNSYAKRCTVINNEEAIIDKLIDFKERIISEKKENVIIFIDEIYEILKNNASVRTDLEFLLREGNSHGMHFIISSDSILDEDIYSIFDESNASRISFYLTSKNEYNMFFKEPVISGLGTDGMYKNNEEGVIRITVPFVMDEEIERVVNYEKEDKK